MTTDCLTFLRSFSSTYLIVLIACWLGALSPDRVFAQTADPIVAIDWFEVSDSVPKADRGLFKGPQWTITDSSSREGNSSSEGRKIVFRVNLDDCEGGLFSSTTCKADWAVRNRTAINGSDYTSGPVSGTLSYTCPARKECTGGWTLTLPIREDTMVELTETLTGHLSNAKESSIEDGFALGTITNDDSASVSIRGVTDVEGELSGPSTIFRFPVTLNRSVDTAVQVTYSTSDSTAKHSERDYLSQSGTLRFNGIAGEVQYIEVEVPGDDKIEPNETFIVNLNGVSASGRAVSLGTDQAFGTIVDRAENANTPEPPTGVSASDGESGRVRVEWDDVADASLYRITRATSSDAEGSEIGSTPTQTYDDYTVDSGVTYFYRVKACNADGCSKASDWDSGFAGESGGASELTLTDSRFSATVEWRDFQGNRGSGRTAALRSDNSGIFYFFSPNNWEMLLKVLDGCALNGHYWVLAAATTDVEYRLEIEDSSTGQQRAYFNPLGESAETTIDTSAFPCGDRFLVADSKSVDNPDPSAEQQGKAGENTSSLDVLRTEKGVPGPCRTGDRYLCLASGRYEVTVNWWTPQTASQIARTVNGQSPDTGLFYFRDPANWEFMVKALDGCGINGHFWVFSAATTDVQYDLVVRETATGREVSYFKPFGKTAPAITDTRAFPCQ